MKNKSGGIIIALVIVGFVGYFIISTVIEETKKNTSVDDDLYTDDITIDTEEAEGWPPGLGDIEMELEENKLKKNYYLILDGSGSMSGDKMKTAKEALTRFINLVPPEANLGLLVFDKSGLSERSKLGSSRQQLINQIDKVSASGYTPLRSSLQTAYKKINLQAARQLGYGEYNIVVVTDGEASDGEEPDYVVDTILSESPVVIHTIGFQIGEYHSLNQPGRILYKSAKNFEELSEGLEEVLAEMEDFSVTDFEEQ
jgi:Ca-activated chloride channel family protein